MKKFRITDIAKLNSKNWATLDLPEFLTYLDTGSVTKNRVYSNQRINTRLEKIPSRAKRKVDNHTIIYSTVRPIQEHHAILCNISENTVVSTGFTTIDVNCKIANPFFVYYYLTQEWITKRLQQIASNNASSYPSIRPEHIGQIEIVLPSFEIQNKIVSILNKVDDAMRLNKLNNILLEKLAKLIYDYWFVQFDFPDANEKPYKSSGGKMVYNEELKREIPEGWDVKTLLDIAKFTNGLACQKFKPKENEDAYRVIKIREMGSGFTDNSEFVSVNIPEKIVINNGDVLFSWSATLDVKIWTGGKGALNQHIFKVTSKKYPRSYYYFELLNYLEHFKMQAELRKTTMGHITQDHLKQSRITIPPIELIKRLDKIINPILEKQVKLDEENQKLSELRDWLLPMLMNGQVRVGEINDDIEIKDEAELHIAAELQENYNLFIDPYEQKRKANAARKKAPKQAQIIAMAIQSHAQVNKNLYRTKGEKIVEIIEKHINQDFGREPMKLAAGPASFEHLVHIVEPLAKKMKWFYVKEKEEAVNIISHKYIKDANFNGLLKRAHLEFEQDQNEIDRILKLFTAIKTTKEAEIYATVYSAWNNLIIRKREITREAIVSEARENWHESKLKIKRPEFFKGIDWLKDNNLIPQGNGKEVK